MWRLWNISYHADTDRYFITLGRSLGDGETGQTMTFRLDGEELDQIKQTLGLNQQGSAK